MKKLFTSISLFACFSLLAAAFSESIAFRSQNGSHNPSAALPSGISHRWRASDLSISPVTDWVDEIQGYHLNVPHLAGSNAGPPLLGSQSVLFYGTNGLAITNLTLAENSDTFLCVFQINNPSNETAILVHDTSGGKISILDVAGYFYDPFGFFIVPVYTTPYDWVYAGHSGSTWQVYTNGQPGPIRTSVWGGQSPVTLGTSAVAGGYGHGLDGKIMEFIVWTNVVGFNSLQVSNIHYYCTNVYGYSP